MERVAGVPSGLLLIHPCLIRLLLPTLTAERKPWSQHLSLILGSSTGNGPSVAQPPLLDCRMGAGPSDGFNIRRAWLQKKRRAWLRPSPFPHWPRGLQEGGQPPER